MKVLVISDIHENFHNLAAILDFAGAEGIKQGIVLGDLINSGIMHKLGESGLQFKVIFGNNDGDRFKLTKAAGEYANIELFDIYTTFLLAELQVFATHYMDLAEIVFAGGQFDLVLGGHDHQQHYEVNGEKVLLNPGEVSGHMHGEANFAVFDSATATATLYKLAGNWVDLKDYKRSGALPQIEVKALAEK